MASSIHYVVCSVVNLQPAQLPTWEDRRQNNLLCVEWGVRLCVYFFNSYILIDLCRLHYTILIQFALCHCWNEAYNRSINLRICCLLTEVAPNTHELSSITEYSAVTVQFGSSNAIGQLVATVGQACLQYNEVTYGPSCVQCGTPRIQLRPSNSATRGTVLLYSHQPRRQTDILTFRSVNSTIK